MASRADVIEELKNILDPELMINIMDLGLVYRVETSEDRVEIDFTLTYPGCPVGPLLQKEIVDTLRDVTGIEDIRASLVWDPPWGPELMSEVARLSLGYPI